MNEIEPDLGEEMYVMQNPTFKLAVSTLGNSFDVWFSLEECRYSLLPYNQTFLIGHCFLDPSALATF